MSQIDLYLDAAERAKLGQAMGFIERYRHKN